jgi:hypothetical protein
MKPEIKQKWVQALKSGKYRQGKGSLKNKLNEYCCLGVLCDLHSKETSIKWNGDVYLDKCIQLPSEVMEWAGIDNMVGRSGMVDSDINLRPIYLTDLNDSGRTFKEIAEIIEEKL